MYKWSYIKEALMYAATQRGTFYSNSYPYNCAYVYGDGGMSADCIGILKIGVNTPDQFYSWTPDTYGNPGGPNIGDLTEQQLIDSCSDATRDFTKLQEGMILMTTFDGCGEEYGHGGWFVGEFIDPKFGTVQNTIECTSCYEYTGIITTYTDEYGYHWTSKGGRYIGQWDKCGHLYGHVDYSETPAPVPPQPTPTPTPEVNEPDYLTYDDVNKCWLPIVKGTLDYAGVFGHDVDCVAVRGATYQVHCWGGDGTEKYDFADWLEPVSGFDINDYENGFAGNYHPIDAFAISTPGYTYKVHLRGGDWLEEVSSDNYNLGDSENGYAGIIGKPIDAVMIWKK